MTGTRRVRKRSVPIFPVLPTYVALLEPLQLNLQAVTCEKKRQLFVLQVQRRRVSSGSGRQIPSTSSDSWSFARPFADFETFHKRLVRALQHGHFCNAECPWLFSFLSSHFPKKNMFQRSSSVRTVATRREKLFKLLTSTLEFLLDRKNHSCSVATADVAKLFAEFLYGEERMTRYIVEQTFCDSTRRRSLGVQSPCFEDAHDETSDSEPPTDLTICGVCKGDLTCEPDQNQLSICSGDQVNISPADSSSRRRSSVFATSLQCGHQFHDECIVPVLNKTLRCPTCKHQEIE